MSAPILYSGPAQTVLTVNGANTAVQVPLQAEGENGQVKLAIVEKKTRRSNAMFGYIRSTLEDQLATISLTPFDSWSLLPYLYPAYLGVTTNSTTGLLNIGVRPHDFTNDVTLATANGKAPTTIYTPDGRLYSVVRTAITKHPSMKLGVGQALFTAMELTGLADPALALGASGALITGNAITESGASNNLTAGWQPDFINGHWTGAWGSITGFTALDAEDGWELSVDAKYSPLTVQKRTYHMKLDSVEFMVKARLTGQTHSQLLGKVLAHTLGGTLTEGSSTNLVLSGPSSKTITLNDCEVFLDNSGFEFGGTKLNTGEVAFVTKLDFSGSPLAPVAGLVFSA